MRGLLDCLSVVRYGVGNLAGIKDWPVMKTICTDDTTQILFYSKNSDVKIYCKYNTKLIDAGWGRGGGEIVRSIEREKGRVSEREDRYQGPNKK